jgi:hypothetical protein
MELRALYQVTILFCDKGGISTLSGSREQRRQTPEARRNPGVALIADESKEMRRRPAVAVKSPRVALLPDLPLDEQHE